MADSDRANPSTMVGTRCADVCDYWTEDDDGRTVAQDADELRRSFIRMPDGVYESYCDRLDAEAPIFDEQGIKATISLEPTHKCGLHDRLPVTMSMPNPFEPRRQGPSLVLTDKQAQVMYRALQVYLELPIEKTPPPKYANWRKKRAAEQEEREAELRRVGIAGEVAETYSWQHYTMIKIRDYHSAVDSANGHDNELRIYPKIGDVAAEREFIGRMLSRLMGEEEQRTLYPPPPPTALVLTLTRPATPEELARGVGAAPVGAGEGE